MINKKKDILKEVYLLYLYFENPNSWYEYCKDILPHISPKIIAILQLENYRPETTPSIPQTPDEIEVSFTPQTDYPKSTVIPPLTQPIVKPTSFWNALKQGTGWQYAQQKLQDYKNWFSSNKAALWLWKQKPPITKTIDKNF